MKFTKTGLNHAFVVDIDPLEDERGLFARTFCAEEFRVRGLDFTISQCNVSYNRHRGTLRGLHYQVTPHAEVKLVRCTAGAVYDVIVDLRPTSATFTRWFALELSAENRKMLYVPEGCAHGFLTLVSNAEVFYQMSKPYVPSAGRGIRWDDSTIGIRWPMKPLVMSEDDRNHPVLSAIG